MHTHKSRTHKCPEQSCYTEVHATTVATKVNVLNYRLGDYDCGDISRYFTAIDNLFQTSNQLYLCQNWTRPEAMFLQKFSSSTDKAAVRMMLQLASSQHCSKRRKNNVFIVCAWNLPNRTKHLLFDYIMTVLSLLLQWYIKLNWKM